MKAKWESERLYMREMEWADRQDLAEMLQDEWVMWAYEHTFDDGDVDAWLAKQQRRYQEDGFGLWALIRKSDGVMVGQAGLSMQPCEADTVLEIGYLLKHAYWHQGYAREAAAALRDYAFQILDAPWVCSIIKTTNTASWRVACSIGMKPQKTFIRRAYGIDMPHTLYAVKREGLQSEPKSGIL